LVVPFFLQKFEIALYIETRAYFEAESFFFDDFGEKLHW